MIVTIEGDEAQIRDACHIIGGRRPGGRIAIHGRRLLPDNQIRQARILARRRVIRRAFDLARGKERAIALNLARALGASAQLTDTIFETACLLCLETGQPSDVGLVKRGQEAHRALGDDPSNGIENSKKLPNKRRARPTALPQRRDR
jgi:hypothetical protein